MYSQIVQPQPSQLPELQYHISGSQTLYADSRKIQVNDVFIACQGEYADGRNYIQSAIEKGASFVFWEEDGTFQWQPEWTVPNQPIADLHQRAGILANAVYGNVSGSLNILGVTGTNGKTSITQWLAQAMDILENNPSCAIIGTVGNGFFGQLQATTHTTPDPVSVQTLLRQFKNAGAKHIAMEVSSHGLDQFRVNGVPFRTAIFTNLTRDHLDYHNSMAEYGATKARLFHWQGLEHAIINADDAFGAQLIQELKQAQSSGSLKPLNIYSYGFNEQADIQIVEFIANTQGMKIGLKTPWGNGTAQTRLLGRFNAQNFAAALGALCVSGFEFQAALNALAQIRPATGRMDCIISENKPLVVVDYAHTPDALEKALTTLREIQTPNSQLWCVFGCGGNRDRGKRPLMGEVAAKLADKVVITSDNPRMEEPDAIISDILPAVANPALVEVDRKLAIEQAIIQAQPTDIVLIAGKGHETYQDIQGVKQHFSDFEVAEKALVNYETYLQPNCLPIKRWQNYSLQLWRLRSCGMNIQNPQRAIHYLKRIGYYRLSGYFHVFRQWDNKNNQLLESFVEGSDFELVLSLYLFDKKLRLLAMDALERIEMAVRADIAYCLGAYHPLAHKEKKYLHGNFTKKNQPKTGKTRHQEWLERYEELEHKAKRRRLEFVEHNLQKYGCLPIWVACNLWDFGAMSRLYEGMRYDDKNRIAIKYHAINGESFSKWLIALNEIRNIVAHHDRLWNIRLTHTASPIHQDEFWKRLDNTRPFFYFCIMKQMLDVLSPNSMWHKRFCDLLKEFPQTSLPKIHLKRFGLLEDFEEWKLWQTK